MESRPKLSVTHTTCVTPPSSWFCDPVLYHFLLSLKISSIQFPFHSQHHSLITCRHYLNSFYKSTIKFKGDHSRCFVCDSLHTLIAAASLATNAGELIEYL